MPGAVTFGVFLTTGLVLLLVPGPAVVYIVTRSVEHGRAVGIASALGVATGGVLHVVAAAVGLSALLLQSAAAYTVVKLAGAAYLVAVGMRRLVRPVAEPDADPVGGATTEGAKSTHAGERRVDRVTAYRQGVIVNALNPKIAMFFLAFLPQFVDPERGSPLAQTLVLGLTFIALGVLTDGAYAVVAGTLGVAARRRLRSSTAASRATGGVYVVLGLMTALTRRTVKAAA
ncbi:MAG TPA: LysE family translocator [Acidimicrobiales bacterium]